MSYINNELDWLKLAMTVGMRSCVDCPIGSVMICDGEVIAEAHNEVEMRNIPTAHSEILCIERACQALKTKVLDKCVLYCTLEPCPMCLHAIKLAKIPRVVFGAFRDEEYEFKLDCIGGIMANHCSETLRSFFKRIRNKKG